MHLYTLTDLTGRNRNAGRTVIVSGFEVGRRALAVTGISLLVGLIPTMLVGAFTGMYGYVFTPVLFVLAGFYFVEGRSRNGLKLRRYQSILDKRRAKTNEVYICWRPASEGVGTGLLVATSEPRRDTGPVPVLSNARATAATTTVDDLGVAA